MVCLMQYQVALFMERQNSFVLRLRWTIWQVTIFRLRQQPKHLVSRVIKTTVNSLFLTGSGWLPALTTSYGIRMSLRGASDEAISRTRSPRFARDDRKK